MNTNTIDRPNTSAHVKPKAIRRSAAKEAAKGQPISATIKVIADIPEATDPVPGAKRPSKQSQLIGMLQQPDGVTISELTRRFGWLPHSARAALTGVRKAGNTIAKSSAPNGTTTYRIATCSETM